ncbi:MAG: hypothetical protein QOH39_2172 [Verrucomicrobiota bacterium]|jgi:peptidoglycan/xylan/chitin deacetylase (PgdA/CDA1 family)
MRSDSSPVQRLCILNFHGLGEPVTEISQGEKKYWLDAKCFGDILDSVGSRSDVRITFDDGNASDFTIALPLLLARNLKAHFFVVAERIAQKGYLSCQQLRELSKEGMAIESHGMAHRDWLGLNKKELHRELVEARDILQQITGIPITEAACPFGGYNRRILHELRKNGYHKVYTSDGGSSSPDCWIQPRNTILRSYDLPRIFGICASAASTRANYWRRFKLAIKRWR